VIRPTELSSEDLAVIGPYLPDPEPRLRPRPGEGRRDVIPVADADLCGNELAYLSECVRSGWVSSSGPFVDRFEEAFASAVGCRHAVSCSSGTAALHLSLAALGIGTGDEVIVPAFTMIAVANAVSYTGARPVLADVQPETGNLDPSDVEARIGPRTKGIIAVHTYGHPAEMDALVEIARARGLFLVEDAAEAHGARWRGRPAGSLADVATFSFYGNKIVTTGEGGMVTTDDEPLARVVRRLRDHAFSEDRHFWHAYRGFNYRMTNLQAAVGLAQVERLETLVDRRRRRAGRYETGLKGLAGLSLPVERPGTLNAFWMYAIRVDDAFGCSRDELRRRLADDGIETRTFFVPIHFQPIYFELFRGQRFPVSEEFGRRGLYLPSGQCLLETEVDAVAASIAGARGPRR
jgi:perosamine synthetase